MDSVVRKSFVWWSPDVGAVAEMDSSYRGRNPGAKAVMAGLAQACPAIHVLNVEL
jgi:hypothetical protein